MFHMWLLFAVVFAVVRVMDVPGVISDCVVCCLFSTGGYGLLWFVL